MSTIGPLELVVFLVIIILLYALGKVPEFGGAISKGIAEFGYHTNSVKRSNNPDSEIDPYQDVNITDQTT
jgi:Sec-independent protein translocase protein TatA